MSYNDNDLIIPGFDKETVKDFKIRLRRIPTHHDMLLIECHGVVDNYNTKFFKQKVDMCFNARYIKLIFDCGGIDYMSSTGIGAFVDFLKTAKNKNGNISIINMKPKVFEVFQLLGFSTFFNFDDSFEEAINNLAKNITVDDKEIIFPRVFKCPICDKKLSTKKSGRFRCPQCKSVIAIDNQGRVSIV